MSEYNEPVPNKALLNEVLSVVRLAAEHDMWDQREWLRPAYSNASPVVYNGREFCGTAGCFAGWTVMLDGWKPELHKDSDGYDEVIISKGEDTKFGWQADSLAMKLLGITEAQADVLFEGSNSLEDLQSIVKQIGEGETFDEPWEGDDE